MQPLALALALTPTSWHTYIDQRISDPEDHVTIFDGVTFGDRDLSLSVQLQTTDRPDKPDWDLIRQGFSASSSTLFKVEYMPDGRAICDFQGTEGKAEAYGGPRLDDGRWHQVTCTKTADAVTLAVDGREVARDDEAIGELNDGGDIIVGAHNAKGTSERFEGLIRRVHIATSGVSRENSEQGTREIVRQVSRLAVYRANAHTDDALEYRDRVSDGLGPVWKPDVHTDA